jgi:hypothetical protein
MAPPIATNLKQYRYLLTVTIAPFEINFYSWTCFSYTELWRGSGRRQWRAGKQADASLLHALSVNEDHTSSGTREM